MKRERVMLSCGLLQFYGISLKAAHIFCNLPLQKTVNSLVYSMRRSIAFKNDCIEKLADCDTCFNLRPDTRKVKNNHSLSRFPCFHN